MMDSNHLNLLMNLQILLHDIFLASAINQIELCYIFCISYAVVFFTIFLFLSLPSMNPVIPFSMISFFPFT